MEVGEKGPTLFRPGARRPSHPWASVSCGWSSPGGSQLYLRLPRLGAGCEGRGGWCGAPAESVPGQFACSVAGARLGLRSLGPPAALMSMEEEPAAENLGTRKEHSLGLEKGAQLFYYRPCNMLTCPLVVSRRQVRSTDGLEISS